MPSRLRFQALVFLGSFLAFCLEPAAAKLMLPRFGGSAYVWTGAMMFFQAMLLIAYLYGRRASRHPRVHAAVLALPLFFFPLSLPQALPASGPLAQLLWTLALTVGAPFFVLATTIIVAQSWLMGSDLPEREDAYFLYAASNAGAAVALFAYPIVIEPLLSLPAQGWLWRAVYTAYAALCFSCAPRGRAGSPEAAPQGLPPSMRQRALWLLLSAVPCAGLLAATNLMSMDFAAVPLLWTMPLAVYLLTLVLNFKRTPWYPERLNRALLPFFAALVALSLFAMAAAVHHSSQSLIARVLARLLDIGTFGYILFALFALSMIFHRSLAAGRPSSERAMAAYYSWMAAGGLLGSVLVGLVVPLLGRRIGAVALDWAAVGTVAAAAMILRDWKQLSRRPWITAAIAAFALVIVGAVAGAGHRAGTVYSVRSFYGISSVEDRGDIRWLFHGNTDHGMQNLKPRLQSEPLSYYNLRSPLAEAWQALGGDWRRVGVVGLGAGSIAAYGRPGMAMDFYELDPDVVAIARNWFTYLSLSPAAVLIVTGDARLSLEKTGTPDYDALILDAFNSGAVPIHLLTKEAFVVYLRRLKPGGVILVHVSNRYLDLRPVLAAAARDLGLRGAAKKQVFAGLVSDGKAASSWAALSSDPAKMRALIERKGWRALDPYASRVSAWTDQHASLLPALDF